MPASKTRNRTPIPLYLCQEKHIGVGDVEKIGCVYFNTFSELNSKTIKYLIRKGYLLSQPLSPQEIENILSKKTKSLIGDYPTKKECEWCGSYNFSIQSHHFPISRKDGGNELVYICGSCHSDYHFLSKWGILSLREDLVPYFESTKEWYAKRT